jgi:hypothetical protein
MVPSFVVLLSFTESDPITQSVFWRKFSNAFGSAQKRQAHTRTKLYLQLLKNSKFVSRLPPVFRRKCRTSASFASDRKAEKVVARLAQADEVLRFLKEATTHGLQMG